MALAYSKQHNHGTSWQIIFHRSGYKDQSFSGTLTAAKTQAPGVWKAERYDALSSISYIKSNLADGNFGCAHENGIFRAWINYGGRWSMNSTSQYNYAMWGALISKEVWEKYQYIHMRGYIWNTADTNRVNNRLVTANTLEKIGFPGKAGITTTDNIINGWATGLPANVSSSQSYNPMSANQKAYFTLTKKLGFDDDGRSSNTLYACVEFNSPTWYPVQIVVTDLYLDNTP